MKRLHIASVRFVVLCAAALVGGYALPAIAVDIRQRVWEGNERGTGFPICVDVEAGASPGDNNNGRMRSEVISATALGTPNGNCAVLNSKPANHLKIRGQWFRQVNGNWGFCYGTGFAFNDHPLARLAFVQTFGGDPYCGRGFYRTESKGGMLVEKWRGDGLVVISPSDFVGG